MADSQSGSAISGAATDVAIGGSSSGSAGVNQLSVATNADPMDSGDGEKKPSSARKRRRRNNISWNDIKVVQNLIERCLVQNMTQAEIITALKVSSCNNVFSL